MKPFESIAEATSWWMSSVDAEARLKAKPLHPSNGGLLRDPTKQGECCLLVDFTDIGVGIQRRQVQNQGGLWVMSHA